MLAEKNKTAKLIALGAAGLVIVGLIVYAVFFREPPQPEIPPPSVTPRVEKEYVTVYKTVTEEKKVSCEVIQDGLRDMGELITQEYFFTDVVSFSDTKKILYCFDSESSFIASYDGVVTAGIDFRDIELKMDDINKLIRITVPKAAITGVTVKHDSFELYYEKEGLGNSLSVADFNVSLVELEKRAEAKAVEKGILTKADENAQSVITGFIGGLIDLGEYRLEYRTA